MQKRDIAILHSNAMIPKDIFDEIWENAQELACTEDGRKILELVFNDLLPEEESTEFSQMISLGWIWQLPVARHHSGSYIDTFIDEHLTAIIKQGYNPDTGRFTSPVKMIITVEEPDKI